MAKISIIVPIYKVERYLERCVKSIQNQTYKDLEIILVDDGSPDNCGKMCDAFAEKDNRIIVIHQKNQGLSAARNSGMAVATGEYIAFLDSDDWVNINMYEVMLNALIKYEADIVACDLLYTYEHSKTNDELTEFDEILLNQKELLRLTVDPTHFAGYMGNKLIKKSVIADLKFDESLASCEDIDFISQLVMNCKFGVYLPIGLIYYFQHAASMTNERNFSYRKIAVIDVYERLIERYKSALPEVLSQIYCEYLKININVKGRYLRSKINEPQILSRLNNNIGKTYRLVMDDKKISFATKLNIRASKLMPVFMLTLKQKILAIKNKG